MAALDPVLEARLRDMDAAHARDNAALQHRIEEEHAARRQLDIDLFGRKDRPNDVGRIGELQREIVMLREELRSAKLWLQGLMGSILLAVISAIVLVLLETHR